MKRIWLILIALLAIAGIVVGGIGLAKVSELDNRLHAFEEAYVTTKITLSIDYGDLKPTESHELSLPGDATAWDALNRVAEVDATWNEEYESHFINGISGVGTEETLPSHWWMYYVNGEIAPVGVDKFTLESGEHIDFKYEIPL
jgi:hypothetical protein